MIIGLDSALPSARQHLVSVVNHISSTEATLERLSLGKRKLESEMSRVAAAREDRASEVEADAQGLVARIRSGKDFLLSMATGSRSHAVSQRLAASAVEMDVASAALIALESELQSANRELAELQDSKATAIKQVMVEAAGGFRTDLADLLEDLKMVLVNLSGLHRAVAPPSAEWRPEGDRLVIEIPAVAGRRAEALICSRSAVESAKMTWLKFATQLERDPLASVESLRFEPIAEGDDRTPYHERSSLERHEIDVARAAGVAN